MRILLSIHHLLDRNAGAPGVTINLAEQFRALGHEADIASLADLGIEHESVGAQLHFPWYLGRRRKELLSSYDVLDLSSGDGWLIESLPREGKAVFVCRSHGLEHMVHERRIRDHRSGGLKLSWKYPLYHGGWRLFEVSRSFRRADVGLFLNQEERRYGVEAMGIPQSKTRIVDNGISQSYIGLPFQPDSTGPLRIAVIGTYIERKIHKLPSMLNRLLPKHRNWKVGFYGTQVDEDRVRSDFAPEVQNQIEVLTRYDNKNLPQMLEGYNVLLFPSLFEGSPLVPFEAMACGLALVSSALPALSERIKNGVAGLLVQPGDLDALEEALETLHRNPELLAALRRNGYLLAQDFSWRRVAADTLAIYEEQIALRPGQGK